jgi:hypothetical protein
MLTILGPQWFVWLPTIVITSKRVPLQLRDPCYKLVATLLGILGLIKSKKGAAKQKKAKEAKKNWRRTDGAHGSRRAHRTQVPSS